MTDDKAQSGLAAQAGASDAVEFRLRVAIFNALALLQAVLVVVTGGGATRVIAVLLALAGLNLPVRALSAIAGLIVINFGVHLAGLSSPLPYRVAHASILMLYGAVTIAGIASLIPRVRFSIALAVSAFLAVAVISAESVIARVIPPVILGGASVRWVNGAQTDPVTADSPAPYAVLRTVYPDNPRSYFETPPKVADVAARPTEYSVTYSFNALGCRGRDYPIPNPRSRRRILVLGGASALGVGVRDADTFASRLEALLNSGAPGADSGTHEVINCGADGRSTRDQRLFFEQVAFRYEPDVVLVAMSERDNLSHREEVEQGFVYQPGLLDDLFLSARLIQWGRHEGRRPFDYANSADELKRLNDALRARGARLAVVVFRSADIDTRWAGLVTSLSTTLAAADVPIEDLGLALLRDHRAADLSVHPINPQPNEVAHRGAADELERFLRRNNLLG